MLALTACAGLAPAAEPYLRLCHTRTEYAEVSTALAASSPMALLRGELNELMLDCQVTGWDGYGAEAVSIEAYAAAQRFIRSLPAGFPTPELAADPDGCVNFDWHVSPRRTLVVSVHPDFRLDFAALIGTAKIYGSEPFFASELPASVRDLVRRVCPV